MSLKLAQSYRQAMSGLRPLSGAQRKWHFEVATAAFDPFQTSTFPCRMRQQFAEMHPSFNLHCIAQDGRERFAAWNIGLSHTENPAARADNSAGYFVYYTVIPGVGRF
jgi:hypothetical protein